MPEQNELRAPRGTHDRLPGDEPIWRFITKAAEKRADGFGFGRIETPTFERAELFTRSLGEATDIVSKEMFEVRRANATEEDNTDQYILRPEGTAPIIRAYLEHGMHTWPQPVKLWYLAPMFRAERPQKGRYRQHWQIGFEAIGDGDPTVDAMLIFVAWQIFGDLGIRKDVVVDINSMGCATDRPKYRKALVAYYQPLKDKLCPACQERLLKNPFRLLDCKEEGCQAFKEKAPQMLDSLCNACREHFRIVLESLDELQVAYDLNPRLVRGMDYYTRTTFEFRAADDTRRQNALGGGGRYDGLIESFGGQPTPGIGFGIGVERALIERIRELNAPVPALPGVHLFIIQLGERAKKSCFSMMAQLGQHGFSALCNPTRDGLKTQLRLANKAGARYALIVGQREALDGTAILRDMNDGTQETIQQSEIKEVLTKRLAALEPLDDLIAGVIPTPPTLEE